MCEPAGVIKISDDSSTDSDMGLDSDFNSSPESVFETDDVIFVEHTYNGFAAEDRSKQSSSTGLAPSSLRGAGNRSHFILVHGTQCTGAQLEAATHPSALQAWTVADQT